MEFTHSHMHMHTHTHTNIHSLPYAMGHMTKLKSILLDGNPLRTIRRDIVQVG